MKTVLITGCSSGYGRETAAYFLEQGWNVIATMRTPRPDVLPQSSRLRLLQLDVTRPDSIAQALDAAGPLDVLVNNAGLGLFGAFEATPMSTVRDIFETNTFGTMAMCQAVIPQFRQRGAGCIVNVTSSAVLAPFPLVAAYTASKTAIEGFTASLEWELKEFGVRVKLVQPGYGPSTSFTANGQQRMQGLIPPAYESFAHSVFAGFAQIAAVTTGRDVAQVVWEAVNDGSDRLRFAAGADALALAGRGTPATTPA
ncbi:SDR family oxidoreductase [Oxalobacteraceae bacterium A2-2]